MARTFNNLWRQFISFENIFHAYRAASGGKWELEFYAELEIKIITLINELQWEMYKPRPYRSFYVYEPKKRLISAPAFRDRVVHHAITQVASPLFENKFIGETFACIVGRGTHQAAALARKHAKQARRNWGNFYILKCDIASFFPSIDHAILESIICKTIYDKRLFKLISVVIQSYESPERDGKGMPIGALTSQLFANVYLDLLDHYVKEICRVKYYIRYMDDFIILHNDKNYLHELLGKIENYLHDNLKLNLNPKTGVFPISQGIDFCGYRIWPAHVKPRKTTVKRAKKRLKKYAKLYRKNPVILDRAKASIQSFLGHMKHCSGYKTTVSLFEKIVFKNRDLQS
jgi:retron-type reverse transcriptase